MVLSGLINKDIVSAINRQGGKAVGICGKDANLMIARKITEMPDPESNLMKAVDIGYVGDPVEVNPHIVDVISKSDLIPVIAPVGISREGETLNINADTFASALAARMKAKRLLLLTDVEGVLDKDKKLVHQLTIEEARELIKDGIISGGMIPKIEGCIEVVEAGVEAVVIIDGARAALRAARAVHRARRRHAGRPRAPQVEGAQRMSRCSAAARDEGRGRRSTPQRSAFEARAGRRRAGAASTTTRVWVFDLDNTLYPSDCNLFAEVDQRMGAFIAQLPRRAARARALSAEDATTTSYGTTLSGLMQVHKVDPHAVPRLRARHRPRPLMREHRSWRPPSTRCPAASSSSPTARAAMPSASPRSSACCICSRTSATSPPASSCPSPTPDCLQAHYRRGTASTPPRRPCSRTCRTTSRRRTRSA